MVFSPRDKSRVIAVYFPSLTLNGQALNYVNEFCYLGHIITNTLSDERDVRREIRNLYTGTNIRRFNKCSTRVKLCLFKSYCICLYGVSTLEKLF